MMSEKCPDGRCLGRGIFALFAFRRERGWSHIMKSLHTGTHAKSLVLLPRVACQDRKGEMYVLEFLGWTRFVCIYKDAF